MVDFDQFEGHKRELLFLYYKIVDYEWIMQSKILEGRRYATGFRLYIFYNLAVFAYYKVHILLKGYVEFITDYFGWILLYELFITG